MRTRSIVMPDVSLRLPRGAPKYAFQVTLERIGDYHDLAMAECAVWADRGPHPLIGCAVYTTMNARGNKKSKKRIATGRDMRIALQTLRDHFCDILVKGGKVVIDFYVWPNYVHENLEALSDHLDGKLSREPESVTILNELFVEIVVEEEGDDSA